MNGFSTKQFYRMMRRRGFYFPIQLKRQVESDFSKAGKTNMLVLTRRVGESILIGDNIVITVNEIKGGRTILGINAPKDVKVFRGELHANKAVASVDSGVNSQQICLSQSPISPARIPTASDADDSGFGVIAFPSGGSARLNRFVNRPEAIVNEAVFDAA